MPPSVSALCDTVLQLPCIKETLDRARAGERVIIGITGCPGSGKSTLSDALAETLNAQGLASTVVPMDGYHHYRSYLDAQPDPSEWHKRRGSPKTFDSGAFCAAMREIASGASDARHVLPGWSHALKDPTPGGVVIEPHHRVVILEGLYLALGEQGFEPLITEHLVHPIVHLSTVSVEEAMQRVIARNAVAIFDGDVDRATKHADYNDMPNARLVHSKRHNATVVIGE
ncbi:hypothetical protein KIPB_003365 [Kipferlia bialata]|uniref:Phosphoribulokinase/uridine kinase domain-containing protein n=1 Tax=Kipferlia bialata TaxID=797122 RepID=A0A9K3CS46_9EUKA|nr:hypothetical protein KIPB_003365 [Kipferlia bialata]|eukprot:g3365.t1